MQGTQKILSNNGFRMANCFCCLSQNAIWCTLITAVKNYKKVLKNCKTFSPRPRPRPNVQDQDQDFHFLSSRRLETNTLVSRTTSLHDKTVFHNTTPNMQDRSVQDQTNFWSQTGHVLRRTFSDNITGIDYMHVLYRIDVRASHCKEICPCS